MRRMKVVRTIVYEGEEAWIKTVLHRSLFIDESTQPLICSKGTISIVKDVVTETGNPEDGE